MAEKKLGSRNFDLGLKYSFEDVQSPPKATPNRLVGYLSGDKLDLSKIILFMFDKRSEKGIIDFLVNRLYEVQDQELDYYIPKLR